MLCTHNFGLGIVYCFHHITRFYYSTCRFPEYLYRFWYIMNEYFAIYRIQIMCIHVVIVYIICITINADNIITVIVYIICIITVI